MRFPTSIDELSQAFSAVLPTITLYAIPTAGFIWRYSWKPEPKSSKLPASQAPGVTILRPLKGVDINLKENLASSFRLDYPKFEIIFSVASEKDPAIEAVRELKEEFPNVDATMIIGDVNVGVNPKINNLIRSYAASKYEIVWILDSNCTVHKDTLGRSVDQLMLPRVGLVHHIPTGVRPEGYGSVVEGAFLNTAHAKMYITINKVAVASCIVGKSNLFWKASLNPVGGLSKFGRFMSEDNIIGNTIWNQRLRHLMTADVACQPLGKLSLQDYFMRRARWTRIRKYTVVGATLFEPFSESIVNALLAAHGMQFYFGISAVTYFLIHMTFWFLIDVTIATILAPDTTSNLLQFFVAWFVREITALPVYLYACAGSTVEWRGTLYRLKNDGTVEQAPDSMQPLLASKQMLKAENGKIMRDDVYLHPLVTYTRSLRMLVMGVVASVLFTVAYLTDILTYPFIFFFGRRGRLGLIPPVDEPIDPHPNLQPNGAEFDLRPKTSPQTITTENESLSMRVAGMITGRTYAGRALSLSDVWHSMFVAIGLVSSFRRRDEGMSPLPPPSKLKSDESESDTTQKRKRRPVRTENSQDGLSSNRRSSPTR
ncbi:hypothetical protein HDU67_005420 [Dinochytrium kinnereticum]|nr:hypothetical protein HDU67_005420 [Dinochytrium kinnereticum]